MLTSNRRLARPFVVSVFAFAAFAVGASSAAAQFPTDPPPAEPAPPPPPPPPSTPGGLKIEGKDATVKLGFLAQPSYEFLSRTAAVDETFQHFYLRRARLLVGMTLGSQFELFFETETPNLGRNGGGGGGVAPTVGMAVQDLFTTWKPADEFKLDVGLMLIPLSHNGLQGATSLLGLDYFAFSFQQSGGMQNYVGRDTGVQARGLIAGHLEYRLGVFTGRRAPAPTPPMMDRPSQQALRFAARVQYNVFDAENAFFYGGTYHGGKRVLSFGAGMDIQKDYKAFAGDAFFDWPLGNDVATWQLDLVHYDGDVWAPIPKQTDLMTEAGYRIGALKLSPIIRFEMAKMDTATAASPDITRFGFGLSWWYMGHNANVKLFYTYVKPEANGAMLASWSQLNVQTQFFVF